MVHPRELDKASVRSLLADALTAQARATPTPDETKARDRVRAGDRGRRKEGARRPVGCRRGRTLRYFERQRSGNQDRRSSISTGSSTKRRSSPCRRAPRPTRGTRTVALRQVPLWLVARACEKQQKPVGPAGFAAKLAARALEAAGRQTDNQLLLAMLREAGENALARGDRGTAEAAWRRMLALVIEPPESKLKRPGAKPSVAPRQPRRRPEPRPRRRGRRR